MFAELGFQRSCSEHGVYMRIRGGDQLIVEVYIDDLIITSTATLAIEELKREMKEKFQMSDLRLFSYYLGIEVVHSVAGIALCQSADAGKLLEWSSMISYNSVEVPMENRLKQSKTSVEAPVNATEYHGIVVLRYLLHTWPKLSFAIGYLSRFMEEPHSDHLTAVKRVLRYIADT
jgi:hypothetical protein